MRFNTTVAALAIMLVVPVFGTDNSYAETKPKSNTTTDIKKTEVKKAEKVAEKEVTVTVAAGDTLSSIAEANQTTWVRIFNANEAIANPDVINVGNELRIPKAEEELTDRYGALIAEQAAQIAAQAAAAPAPVAVAPTATTVAAYSPAPAPARGVTSVANSGNRYAWGNCTWYVFNRKPNIGSFWGNANQWIGSAQAAGFSTGSAPVAGAIGAQGNHVVYVESVSGGMVNISEMNYAGGLGVLHYRTVPASDFYYIYA